MPVLSGVCSLCETDGFVLVSIGDAFAEKPWGQLEPVLEDLTDRLQQTESRAILLNLSALGTTGSAVVTAVLRIWKRLSAIGSRIVVYAPSEETRSTLKLAGLRNLLTIVADAEEGLYQLGVSRRARIMRRETLLLKYTSPIAAAGAVASLLAVLLSLSPAAFQPSILLVLILSAMIASCGGWMTAARERGVFRHLSRVVSATGIATLIMAIGHWTI